MPTINKQFSLEVTPEKFLEACSLMELMEIELMIGTYIRRKKAKEANKNQNSKDLNDGRITAIGE